MINFVHQGNVQLCQSTLTSMHSICQDDGIRTTICNGLNNDGVALSVGATIDFQTKQISMARQAKERADHAAATERAKAPNEPLPAALVQAGGVIWQDILAFIESPAMQAIIAQLIASLLGGLTSAPSA